MTAGLPKSGIRLPLFLACLAILVLTNGLVLGQEDPPAAPTLEEVVAIIEGNELLSEEQKAGLVDTFSTAVNEAYLTIEEASALLDIAQLDQLTDEDEASFTTNALETVLAALNAGEVDFEGASASLAEAIESGSEDGLDDSLGELATPTGILNAIGKAAAKAGLDDDGALLDQVEQLISDGVPPGIVLRVAKAGLRSGLESGVIVGLLSDLGTLIAGGVSPGNAANTVTGPRTEQEQKPRTQPECQSGTRTRE